jgi:citrate lyase subunit beta/citryl-CoA lyase
MRLRSLLYVPAHESRFLAKASERGADAIILDLEDGVPETAKLAARHGLPSAVAAASRAGAPVFVRVNATAESRDADVAAAVAGGAKGIVLPKAGSIEEVSAVLRAAGRETSVIPLIEDPGALTQAAAIAVHPAVLAMGLGAEDFATAIGARPSPEVLRLPKQLVHYAAKAAGRLSLGMFRSVADISDQAAILEAAIEARSFGFDGAACVHPSVVPLLNRGFSPSPDEVAEARAVLAALGEGGAARFHGRMIDKPVADRARRTLLLAGETGTC